LKTDGRQIGEYLKLAFNQAGEFFYIKDSKYRFVTCNWAFADFFGLDSPEAAEGKRAADLMPALAADRDRQTDSECSENGRTTRCVLHFDDGKGDRRHFNCLKVPLRELDAPAGIFCIMTDITDEEREKESFRGREAVNSAIIRNAPVGISVRDTNGNLLLYNKAWQKIWNSSDEKIREDQARVRTELKLDHSDSYLAMHHDKLLEIYTRGGELFVPEVKTRATRDDGLSVWVSQHFYAIMNPDETVQCVVVITVDISDQVYSRKALKTTQQNYRNLSETIPVGVFRSEVRENALILSMNPAFRRMFGFEGEYARDVRLADLLCSDTEEKRLLELLGENGRVDAREIPMKKTDGQTFWASLTMSTLTAASVVIAEGVVNDITGRMNAFRQLEKTIDGTVMAMSRLVDMKDPYTSGHQKRVAHLACAIARELGMKPEMTDGLRLAGMLHDVGKMAVPTEILTKPGAITRSEMLLLREHAENGYDILKSIDFPWPVADIVLQHHERIDGSGYPLGIRGHQMLTEAKVLAVADVVEAMATMRPYRASLGLHEALQTITAGSGIHFDRQAAEACVRLFIERGYNLPDDDTMSQSTWSV
jgi:putative nucleotidyltransferase with HDIG domain/PAS domain S-box-containing protein